MTPVCDPYDQALTAILDGQMETLRRLVRGPGGDAFLDLHRLTTLMFVAGQEGQPVAALCLMERVATPAQQRLLLQTAWVAAASHQKSAMATWAHDRLMADHGQRVTDLYQLADQHTSVPAAAWLLEHEPLPPGQLERGLSALWATLNRRTCGMGSLLTALQPNTAAADEARALFDRLTQSGDSHLHSTAGVAAVVAMRLGRQDLAHAWMQTMDARVLHAHADALRHEAILRGDLDGLEVLKARRVVAGDWSGEVSEAVRHSALACARALFERHPEAGRAFRQNVNLAGTTLYRVLADTRASHDADRVGRYLMDSHPVFSILAALKQHMEDETPTYLKHKLPQQWAAMAHRVYRLVTPEDQARLLAQQPELFTEAEAQRRDQNARVDAPLPERSRPRPRN